MNERIKLLAEQAKGFVDLNQHVGGTKGCMVYTYDGLEKFAELIVLECIRLAMDEIVLNEDIDTITDIEDRCYLQGNNTGVVDTVVSIKQYFSIEQ